MLLEAAEKDNLEVLKLMSNQMEGLSDVEVASRIKFSGLNEVAGEKPLSWLTHLFNNVKNPLIILLAVLYLM